MPSMTERWNSLTAVVLARRAQLKLRVAVALMFGIVFQMLTGLLAAIIWVAAFAGLQAAERVAFGNVSATSGLSRARSIAFLALVFASSVAFSAYGVVMAMTGLAGVLGAALLWTVVILAGTLTSRHSRWALAASIAPPAVLYAGMPTVIISNGGALGEGLFLVLAELVTVVAATALWFAARRRQVARTGPVEATRDLETGLPNSIAAQRHVDELAKLDADQVFVAAISIDRFEQVHAAVGHRLSIDLVRAVAARVAETVFGADVARLSAGVVGMVWTACSMEDAKATVRLLQQAMQRPVVVGDQTIDVSVTIGLAGHESGAPADGAVAISTIDRALIAIGQAQGVRRNVAWFDAARYGDPARNLSLMSEMLQALDNGQMSVAYQPKYHLESGAIVGAEALIRWAHPERGQLAPDMFVPMAEETGHIAAMTLWVLQRAIEDQRRLAAMGHDIPVAVNVSGRLIDDADFTATALRLASSVAGKLIFEVTETAIIGNPTVARQTLEAFRAAGIRISIDDYGAGFSSLSYLKTIPADELKIDRSFVMPMGSSHTDFMLVRSAIELGHSLGLRVVAEGVETEGVLEMLARMHCDVAQGFMISRPIPFAGLATFLEERRLPPPVVPFRRGGSQRAVA
ncbi:MAG: putative bifunctional diguanylate cyclase/phosphodiesterase [Bauldia sp.]